MSHVRLLYQSLVLCLNELCSLIVCGRNSFNEELWRIFFFLVTFCILFFGLLLYILDNAQSDSNTRNILGRKLVVQSKELSFELKMDSGWRL